MLTVILAAVDAFSEEKFELLYLFVLFMDWHLMDNLILPRFAKKGYEKKCLNCMAKEAALKASKGKSSL